MEFVQTVHIFLQLVCFLLRQNKGEPISYPVTPESNPAKVNQSDLSQNCTETFTYFPHLAHSHSKHYLKRRKLIEDPEGPASESAVFGRRVKVTRCGFGNVTQNATQTGRAIKVNDSKPTKKCIKRKIDVEQNQTTSTPSYIVSVLKSKKLPRNFQDERDPKASRKITRLPLQLYNNEIEYCEDLYNDASTIIETIQTTTPNSLRVPSNKSFARSLNTTNTTVSQQKPTSKSTVQETNQLSNHMQTPRKFGSVMGKQKVNISDQGKETTKEPPKLTTRNAKYLFRSFNQGGLSPEKGHTTEISLLTASGSPIPKISIAKPSTWKMDKQLLLTTSSPVKSTKGAEARIVHGKQKLNTPDQGKQTTKEPSNLNRNASRTFSNNQRGLSPGKSYTNTTENSLLRTSGSPIQKPNTGKLNRNTSDVSIKLNNQSISTSDKESRLTTNSPVKSTKGTEPVIVHGNKSNTQNGQGISGRKANEILVTRRNPDGSISTSKKNNTASTGPSVRADGQNMGGRNIHGIVGTGKNPDNENSTNSTKTNNPALSGASVQTDGQGFSGRNMNGIAGSFQNSDNAKNSSKQMRPYEYLQIKQRNRFKNRRDRTDESVIRRKYAPIRIPSGIDKL